MGLKAASRFGTHLAVEMSMMLNAYELLGVSHQAKPDEIKLAYHRKARIYHPDQGGNADEFIELKKAYEILSDEKKRIFMGTRAIFNRPTVRLQPSLSQATSQLFENLAILEDRLQSIVNKR